MNATENVEGYLVKVCKNCGEEFTTTEQRKKYCCNKCKTSYHRNKLILKTV